MCGLTVPYSLRTTCLLLEYDGRAGLVSFWTCTATAGEHGGQATRCDSSSLFWNRSPPPVLNDPSRPLYHPMPTCLRRRGPFFSRPESHDPALTTWGRTATPYRAERLHCPTLNLAVYPLPTVLLPVVLGPPDCLPSSKLVPYAASRCHPITTTFVLL